MSSPFQCFNKGWSLLDFFFLIHTELWQNISILLIIGVIAIVSLSWQVDFADFHASASTKVWWWNTYKIKDAKAHADDDMTDVDQNINSTTIDGSCQLFAILDGFIYFKNSGRIPLLTMKVLLICNLNSSNIPSTKLTKVNRNCKICRLLVTNKEEKKLDPIHIPYISYIRYTYHTNKHIIF